MSRQAKRVVLITGCSSGIGRATAEYLATRGWHVFASARRLEDIRDLASGQIDLLQLDVLDEESRQAAIQAVVDQAGRLDALVNNAGINVAGPLELVSFEDAHQQFETNVWGPLFLAQQAIPVMRKQGGGRIVNVTSVLGRLSVPFSGLYGSSKHALEALSDSLRWELHPWNIKVIVVEPGFVRTKLAENARPHRKRHENHPLYGPFLKRDREARRLAQGASQPLEVARVIERALTDRRPRARYRSGLDAQLSLTFARLIPDRLYDLGIRRVFGLHRPARQ